MNAPMNGDGGTGCGGGAGGDDDDDADDGDGNGESSGGDDGGSVRSSTGSPYSSEGDGDLGGDGGGGGRRDSGQFRFKHDVAEQLSTIGRVRRNLDPLAKAAASGSPARSDGEGSGGSDSDGGRGGGGSEDSGDSRGGRARGKQAKAKANALGARRGKARGAALRGGSGAALRSQAQPSSVVRARGGAGQATGGGDLPWIGILDIFGFEHFETNGFQTFLINTANESIQNTFNHFVFEAELRLFEEEGISLQLGYRSGLGAAGDDSDSDGEDEDGGGGGGGGVGGAKAPPDGNAAPGTSGGPDGGSEFVCPDNKACTEALRTILKAVEAVSREPAPSDTKLLRRMGLHLSPTAEGGGGSSSSSHNAGGGGSAVGGSVAEPSDFFRGGGKRGVPMDCFGICHFAGEVMY